MASTDDDIGDGILVDTLHKAVKQLVDLRAAGDALATALLVGGNDEKADAIRRWRKVTGRFNRG